MCDDVANRGLCTYAIISTVVTVKTEPETNYNSLPKRKAQFSSVLLCSFRVNTIIPHISKHIWSHQIHKLAALKRCSFIL